MICRWSRHTQSSERKQLTILSEILHFMICRWSRHTQSSERKRLTILSEILHFMIYRWSRHTQSSERKQLTILSEILHFIQLHDHALPVYIATTEPNILSQPDHKHCQHSNIEKQLTTAWLNLYYNSVCRWSQTACRNSGSIASGDVSNCSYRLTVHPLTSSRVSSA